MKFTRVQDRNTSEIIAYKINGKKVNEAIYHLTETMQPIQGKRYNSSITRTDRKTKNFIHESFYN